MTNVKLPERTENELKQTERTRVKNLFDVFSLWKTLKHSHTNINLHKQSK